MSINDKIYPHERAQILRSLGFKIRKNKGQINSIKNINYDDKNGDLCINLDTGQVNDFGNTDYSGDFIHLVSLTINKDFKETVKYIESKTRRRLFPDGKENVEMLYGGDVIPEKRQVKKDTGPFWNANNWPKMKKCQEVLEKRGIPKGMEYIMEYDGISLDKLKEMNCGLYGFDDFEFGMSDKSWNKDLYFIFPYATGAMLYRRDDNGKQVRNITGSNSGDSFFNVKKKEKKHNVVFLMKSPREVMSFSMYCTDWKIIGLIAGEGLRELSDKQKEQLDSIIIDGESIVNVMLDCNDPDSYENSLIVCRILNDYLEGRAIVNLINLHRSFKGKIKDFTDIVQIARRKGHWDKSKEDYLTLDEDSSKQLTKAITEAQTTR